MWLKISLNTRCDEISEESRTGSWEIYSDSANRPTSVDMLRRRKFIAFFVPSGRVSTRSYISTYYLSVDSTKVKVCKKMFLSMLRIWERQVRPALEKKTKRDDGTITPDQRGKDGQAVTPDLCGRSIIEHTKSLVPLLLG